MNEYCDADSHFACDMASSKLRISVCDTVNSVDRHVFDFVETIRGFDILCIKKHICCFPFLFLKTLLSLPLPPEIGVDAGCAADVAKLEAVALALAHPPRGPHFQL